METLTSENSRLGEIQELVTRIPPPRGGFEGLVCRDSLAPDNIIFLQRSGARHEPQRISSNYHHRFELAIALRRPGSVRIDRLTYLLVPGDCALIFPNQFHHYIECEGGKFDWLFVTFETRHPDAVQALQNSPRTMGERATELTQTLLAELVTERDEREGRLDTLSISYHLSRLLLQLCDCAELPEERRNIHSSKDVRDVIMEKINRYVHDHLGETLTIGRIASELGYSVSHLRAVFRDRLGVSLGRYMRDARLAEAAQLLQSTALPVSAVGQRSGFRSLYAFSRAFRKAYGTPPRTYRQFVAKAEVPTRAQPAMAH